MAIDFSSDLIDLQRRAHAAWGQMEAYRKQVDAERRAAPRVVVIEGRDPMLRPWTPEEDAELVRLREAAVAAQQAVKAGLVEAGHGLGFDAVQGLHLAVYEAQV